MPEVKRKVTDRIEDIDQQLENYPEPPKNPEMQIMSVLADFIRDVRDRVREQKYQIRWHVECMDMFKCQILGLKPKFNVREFSRTTAPVVIDLEADSPPAPRKRTIPTSEQSTPPTKRQRGPTAHDPVKTERFERPGIGFVSATPAGTPGRPRSKTLMEIRQLIKKNATPGQPGLVSSDVYQPLYTEAVRTWAPHIESFIVKTFAFLQAEVMGIMEQAFGKLMNTMFYKESLVHMNDFINSQRNKLGQQSSLLYTLESQRLFTKDG